MLEKPSIPDEIIIECMQDVYGLTVSQVVFLPIGADYRTAVYRLTTNEETNYFLKLRRGAWDKTAVSLLKHTPMP